MPKINCLGAYILHFDVRPQDTDWLLRLDVACDLTGPLAEKLGIEDVLAVDTIARAPLTLEDLTLTEIKMSCSGLEQHDLEMLAHRVGEFRVIRHEDEGSIERLLRFHIYAPADVTPLVCEYVKTVGQGKAKLTLNTLKQGNLDEQLEASAQPAAEQQTLEGTEPPKRGRGRRVAPFVVPGGSQAEATQ